jgi:hypothetical protein
LFADAQGEHNSRHEAKPAVLEEHARRKSDILQEIHGASDVRD